ncbi:MAG: ketopantoate reductase C-terminal domain-containing protein, partial [bacterium]
LIPVTASHHASMMRDVGAGRRTEIDAMNGYVAKLGGRCGVSAPVNEGLTLLVKALSREGANG